MPQSTQCGVNRLVVKAFASHTADHWFDSLTVTCVRTRFVFEEIKCFLIILLIGNVGIESKQRVLCLFVYNFLIIQLWTLKSN